MAASHKPLLLIAVSLIIALSGASDSESSVRYRGVYLGQMPPGYRAVPFAEQLFSVWSDYGFHLNSCVRFSQDGKELFFSNQTLPAVSGKAVSIWRMQETDGVWTEPTVAVFSSDYDDAGAFYSQTGDTLHFHSLRPLGEKGVPGDADIWYVTREGGDWSRPQRLGHPVNTAYNDMGGAVTKDGTMYFSSDRPGGKGGADVYYIRCPHDKYSRLTNLGEAINTSAEERVVCVAGDETYMIIHRFDRNNEAQNGLYISHKDAQHGWAEAKSMGDYFKVLNATDASVSADGDYLFILSQGNGVYWVNAGIIDYLEDEDLDISRQLINTMCNEDLQAAVLTYRALREKHSVYLDINEYLLNQRGHQLLELEQFADAIALFEILVALFPQSWNAYDSMGEAFFASGHITEAIECYERSLELNPRNENAVMMLERIQTIQHH